MTSCNWTDNVTAGCGGSVEEDADVVALRQSVDTTRFVAQRVLAPIIVSFGIVANLLTIVVCTAVYTLQGAPKK